MTLALISLITCVVGIAAVAALERRPRRLVPVRVLTSRTRRPPR